MTAGEVLIWVNGTSTVVVAAATGVLAWREIARKREQREASDSQIGGLALSLFERLDGWVPLEGVESTEDYRAAARRGLNSARDLGRDVQELLRLAPSASDDVARAVRQGAVRFYQARGHLARSLEGADLRLTGQGAGRPELEAIQDVFHDAFDYADQAQTLLLQAVGDDYPVPSQLSEVL